MDVGDITISLRGIDSHNQNRGSGSSVQIFPSFCGQKWIMRNKYHLKIAGTCFSMTQQLTSWCVWSGPRKVRQYRVVTCDMTAEKQMFEILPCVQTWRYFSRIRTQINCTVVYRCPSFGKVKLYGDWNSGKKRTKVELPQICSRKTVYLSIYLSVWLLGRL